MARPILPSTDVPGVREVSFTIRESMINGLAPDPRTPRNSDFAETMQNLQATVRCAATPDEITQPDGITNGIPVTDWTANGVPVLAKGEQGRWYLGATQVYSADDTWAITPVGATFTAGGPWQAVFFQDIPFFSNGVVFLWGETASRTTDLTVQAIGKDGNRLLLGGVAGDALSSAVFLRLFALWQQTLSGDELAYTGQSFGPGWVLYGERRGGSSDRPFDALLALLNLYGSTPQADLETYLETALKEYRWGMCQLRYPGDVLAFHELASGPIAFSETGVSRLVRADGIYRDQRLHGIGIGGRGCVGGNLSECLFLDAERNLWKIVGDGTPSKVGGPTGGFSHYMENLDLNHTTISFDPGQHTYWIADREYCYLLDARDALSGPFDVFANAVVRDDGGLYGIVNDRTERVSNGGFDSSTGWTLGTGWAISGGTLNGTATTGVATQSIALTAGQRYRVRYHATVNSGSVRVKLGTAVATTRSTSGTWVETITAAGSATLAIQGVTAFTGSIDNISVTPESLDVVFRSWPHDNNERGTKHLTGLQIVSESINSRKGGADYRTDDSEGTYPAGPYTDATPAGAVMPYPRIEYADAKIVATGKVVRGERGILERIKVQYQADDITYRRGV